MTINLFLFFRKKIVFFLKRGAHFVVVGDVLAYIIGAAAIIAAIIWLMSQLYLKLRSSMTKEEKLAERRQILERQQKELEQRRSRNLSTEEKNNRVNNYIKKINDISERFSQSPLEAETMAKFKNINIPKTNKIQPEMTDSKKEQEELFGQKPFNEAATEQYKQTLDNKVFNNGFFDKNFSNVNPLNDSAVDEKIKEMDFLMKKQQQEVSKRQQEINDGYDKVNKEMNDLTNSIMSNSNSLLSTETINKAKKGGFQYER